MKRFLVHGAPASVKEHSDLSTEDALNGTGCNTGNMLITNGLLSQLNFEEAFWRTAKTKISEKEIKERFDAIVFPASNFIHPNRKVDPYGQIAAFLERVDLPVLTVGLGAQAPTENEVFQVPEGILHFLQAVSERTTLIGVRGEFTAELLHSNGIKNVQITGCPSLYTNCNRDMRVEKADQPPIRIAINGSRNVSGQSSDPDLHKALEKSQFEVAYKGGFDFILQNEMPEAIFARGLMEEFKEEDLDVLSKKTGLNARDPRVLYYMCHHFKVFFDIPSWAATIRSYDFTFGTRFHGNVMSILNNVPAMVLTHDSRTTEMCRYFEIPNLPLEDAAKLDPRQLYDQASYDGFNQGYAARYDAYADFLDANGMDHKLR